MNAPSRRRFLGLLMGLGCLAAPGLESLGCRAGQVITHERVRKIFQPECRVIENLFFRTSLCIPFGKERGEERGA